MLRKKTSCLWVIFGALLLSTNAYAQVQDCVIGTHVGFSDADGFTTSRLVCSELRKRGIVIGEPDLNRQTTLYGYRVELNKLGSLIFLRLIRIENGNITDFREVNLMKIEEVADAAPRIAEAMVRKTSVESTQQNDNLLVNETKDPQAKPARFMFGIGLGGTALITKELSSAYGMEVNFQRQMARWSMGLTGRFMGGDSMLFAGNIGGRYFFLPENITPFVGTSIGIYGIGGKYLKLRGGMGAQIEAGLEAMRFTKRSRLGFTVRVDFPFFSHEYGNAYDIFEVQKINASRYVIPVGLHAYYFF